MKPLRLDHGSRSGKPLLGLALALVPFLAGGCSSLAPRTDPSRPTSLMEQTGTEMSTAELRHRTDAFVAPILAHIEQGMDRVRAESADPDVRRRALLLKIEAIPVVYRAAFQPDPLAGVLDLWLLAYQMEGCLDQGEGPCALGAQQDMARQASREMREGFEREVFELAVNTDGAARMRGRIQEIAARHPLTGAGALASRYTMIDELAEILGSRSRDAFAVIGDVGMTLGELSFRLNSYIGDVGRLGRWHAELLAEDLLRREDIADALESVPMLNDLGRSVGGLEQSLGPEGIASVLEEVLGRIREEREATLAEVDRQRRLTLEYARAERRAVLAEVEVQRRAALAGIDEQRVATLAEADVLGEKYVDATTARALEVVDHLVWRLAQLLGGLLVLGALLAALLSRWLRRGGPGAVAGSAGGGRQVQP